MTAHAILHAPVGQKTGTLTTQLCQTKNISMNTIYKEGKLACFPPATH